tara:strand:+ start:829 stop:1272 length:444 start_codon:yes stop_codon:yes gene_type:complete
MGLKRTKLLDIKNVTGISTVGIFTVGITDCTGPVGVASTTYLRGAILHNAGASVGSGGTCIASLYVYPKGAQGQEKAGNTGIGDTNYRLLRISLDANETYFFEPVYPIVLVDRESIVVSVRPPSSASEGTGIGSMVNFQILGDTDVV